MGTMYASIGDTIIVQSKGKSYPWIVSSTSDGSTPYLRSVDPCIACGDQPRNEDAEIGLCNRCMKKANEYLILSWLLEHISLHDDELESALEVYSELDRVGRESGLPWAPQQEFAFQCIKDYSENELSEMLIMWGQTLQSTIMATKHTWPT